MTERKVTISTTSTNRGSVNITGGSVSGSINTTPDLSAYYSNLSKDWATKMDGKVVNEDYSSKYYAENAKISAETAKMEASNATATKEQLDINYESYNNQLQTLTDNSKESINVLTEVSLTELQNKSASSQNEISSFVATSLEDFSSSASLITSNSKTDIQNSATVAKNTAISEIQGQEIESINNIKEEGTIQTNLIKDQVDLAETQAQISKEQADIAKQQVQLAKDEVAKISNVYKFKGSVANFESLPSNADNGDVYDVLDTGVNYAWTGAEWDSLGGALNVDVSGVVHLAGAETITGAKTFTGAVNLIGSDDSNAVGISTNTRFNVHNTGKTILGFGSGIFYINHADYRLRLRGKDKRPHYNSDSNHLALLSDIPDTSNLATKTELEQKQDTLTAGENITIKDGIISATGGSGSGFSLFDIVQKDHILSFEESKGLAMLGSYVYKNGVAGSRYGYADFYEKCLEEYRNSESATIPSVTVTGSIANNDGVLSGFSNGGYVIPEPDITVTSGQSFELALSVKTGDTANGVIADFGRNGQIVGLLAVADGQLQLLMVSLDSASMISCGTLSPNKSHDIVMNYSDSVLTVKVNGETTYTSSVFTTDQMTFCFGGQHSVGGTFTGTINLKKSYITVDNQVVWGDIYKKSANGHTFYDIANKSTVDQLFESCGEAMFYGVDEENERIFLPRRTRTQATMNPDEVNGFVEAGLPNITGKTGHTFVGSNYETVQDGCIITEFDGTKSSLPSAAKSGLYVINIDASLSNPIYGNSDTVQPPASLVLEYMVVGNVTVDKSQTEVTEITTSENDTLPLFYNFYSDEDMTTTGAYINASEGGWHSGNVYLTAYQELVNKLGTGNVKPVTDTFTDYDFVVNQDNMTFRLPLLNGEEDLTGDSYELLTVPASGQAITVEKNGVYCFYSSTSASGQRVLIGNSVSGETYEVWSQASNQALSASVFAKRGSIVKCIYTVPASNAQLRFSPAKGNGNLYYKVANAVTNLEIMDVAKVESTKADKTAVDGQWVHKFLELSRATALGAYAFDLSGYLPNDGYTYEVMFYMTIASGNSTQYTIGTVAKPATNNQNCFWGEIRTTSNGRVMAGNFILPIKDRVVYGEITSAAASAYAVVQAVGYRRIGTNP